MSGRASAEMEMWLFSILIGKTSSFFAGSIPAPRSTSSATRLSYGGPPFHLMAKKSPSAAPSITVSGGYGSWQPVQAQRRSRSLPARHHKFTAASAGTESGSPILHGLRRRAASGGFHASVGLSSVAAAAAEVLPMALCRCMAVGCDMVGCGAGVVGLDAVLEGVV